METAQPPAKTTETNSARHCKPSMLRLAFPSVYTVKRKDCIDLSAFILKGPLTGCSGKPHEYEVYYTLNF